MSALLSQRQLQISIAEVDRRPHQTDQTLRAPKAFKHFIELPIRDAVGYLVECGISTISSSANSADIGGQGHISICYDSLSMRNLEVAAELIAEKSAVLVDQSDRTVLIVLFPINISDTVVDVHDRALAKCRRFAEQN